MNNKKVLLIAGGGTLGRYVTSELLAGGCEVEVICLEDYTSDNELLHYYKARADLDYLTEFLKDRYYDGIVNFIHYTEVEVYKPVHRLLTSKTDQLIFLSSYRVYADLQHPVTETAPHLFDTVEDEEFLKTEDYAVPKSKCEKFIREESGTCNWTVIRPVISFSDWRYDIVLPQMPDGMREHIKNGSPIILPKAARENTAGLDWAGNSGKLIAGLLFKKEALGEAFTVSSAQNLKWGEVADIYTRLCGVTFEWLETEDYLKKTNSEKLAWFLKYDRFFDRTIDNTKILKVTGLRAEDFKSVEYGIKVELAKIL